MKTMLALLKYYSRSFFLSAKGIVPSAVTLILIAVMNNTFSGFNVSNYGLTVIIVFIMGAFTSLSFIKENEDEEMILYLHSGEASYYLSKQIFLIEIALLYGVTALIYPLAISGKFALLIQNPGPFINILCLHCASAYCGSSLLSLLHSRIFKNGRLQILIGITLILLYLLLPYIVREETWLSVFTYLIAPVAVSTELFGKTVGISEILSNAGMIFLYALFYAGVQISLLRKRKF